MKKITTIIIGGGSRLDLFCLLLVGISCSTFVSCGTESLSSNGIYTPSALHGSGRSSDYGGGWDRPDFNYDDLIKVPKNWVARQDVDDGDEEKNPGDGGLYGLFGLFGLMGALPFLLIPLLALLLFIPIPIIGGRHLNVLSAHNSSSSYVANNTMDMDGPMWASRGIGNDMQNILMSIAKDYSSSFQKISSGYSGCLERLSCSMARMAKNIRPPKYAMERLTGLMGGSNNRFVRRIQRGIYTAGKGCSRFKCDLIR